MLKQIKNALFSNFTFIFLFGLAFTMIAFAQDVVVLPSPPDLSLQPTPEQIDGWLETWKGNAGWLGAALLIAQGIILGLKKFPKFQDATGKWKFLITGGLHLVICILTFIVAGKGWEEISLNPVILAAFGTFVYEFKSQVFGKKE